MSKWIKVTERLPHDVKNVMTYSKSIGYRIGFYEPFRKEWTIYTDVDLMEEEVVDSVTQWKPLDFDLPEEWE